MKSECRQCREQKVWNELEVCSDGVPGRISSLESTE